MKYLATLLLAAATTAVASPDPRQRAEVTVVERRGHQVTALLEYTATHDSDCTLSIVPAELGMSPPTLTPAEITVECAVTAVTARVRVDCYTGATRVEPLMSSTRAVAAAVPPTTVNLGRIARALVCK